MKRGHTIYQRIFGGLIGGIDYYISRLEARCCRLREREITTRMFVLSYSVHFFIGVEFQKLKLVCTHKTVISSKHFKQ